MAPSLIITGVPGGWAQGAAPPPRLEINQLIKDQKQFSLYIQALAAMADVVQNDVASHFQLGGIHGLPYTQWDQSGGAKPVQGSAWSGYCTHGSVLFPTWHRPYVALYEQVLQNHAVQIASSYTVDKAAWQASAANLRAPYWDWAANSVPPAEVISKAQVTIIGPNGQSTNVNNPLLSYKFNPVDKTFPRPYSVWGKTLRHATSDSANATSNVQELISDLQGEQANIRTSTYKLLTLVHTWPAFSNHTPGDGGSSSSSLEAIHDGIHVDVGGDGNMSDPAVAAFDPIFFLHHANVDRMLALWQSLNPGVWVSQGEAEAGTWTLAARSAVDTTTSLAPFWNGPQSYWTSAAATKFTNLGYTYPEFVGLNLGDANAVKTAIGVKVNQLYGSATVQAQMPPVTAPGPVIPPAVAAAAIVPPKPAAPAAPAAASHPAAPAAPSHPVAAPAPPAAAHPSAPALPTHIQPPAQPTHPQAVLPIPTPHQTAPVSSGGHTLYDWVARVQAKKYEIGCSFSVVFFIGDFPEDPKQWRSCPAYVGAHNAFVNSAASQCENCREQQDVETEGFVHLDAWLAAHSGLGTFEPSVLEPYLQKNLHWRVQKANREVVPTANVKSLVVDVISNPMKFGHGDMFPHHDGERTHHHTITHGRVGGRSFS
ncbi:hypothetical protein FRB93_008563 [Tulasnella sp. JGI-2019a]|nr:hypothetical protein FRB93_008563 [Tulasnella sp. JGI-2019a]